MMRKIIPLSLLVFMVTIPSLRATPTIVMKKASLFLILVLIVCLTTSCETTIYGMSFIYDLKNNSSDTIQIRFTSVNYVVPDQANGCGGSPNTIFKLAPNESIIGISTMISGTSEKSQYDAALQSNLEQEAKPTFMYGAVLTIGTDSVKLGKEHNSIPNTPMSVLSYTRSEKEVSDYDYDIYDYCRELRFTYTFTDEVLSELLLTLQN